jgi:CelD/BcsL family acetyltransferase involved in cellulose biosynthesis
MTLSIERIDSLSAFQALESSWDRLFEAAATGLPFATFDWASIWWKHFSKKSLLIADRLAIFVVRDADGAVVGIAPMMETDRPGFGPVRTRALHLFGADPNVTELRTVLCFPGRERDVHRALFRFVDAGAGDFDWVSWPAVRADCVAELDRTADVRWGREIPSFDLQLPGSWETFKSGLKRNIRESLRRCYNSLKRDGLAFDFEVSTSPALVGAECDALFRLHGTRAAVDDGVKHPNVFAGETTRRFVRELVQTQAERDHVRFFKLRIGGQVVAMRLGFQYREKLYLYYSGYLPEFGKYSVMTTTVAEILRWAIGQSLTSVNLSPGRDVSKTRWGPVETTYRSAVVCSPSRRSKFAYQTYQSVRQAGSHRFLKVLLKR